MAPTSPTVRVRIIAERRSLEVAGATGYRRLRRSSREPSSGVGVRPTPSYRRDAGSFVVGQSAKREPNIGVGRQTSPYQAVTPPQAAVLRPRYRLSLVKHQRSLTMFLLTRAGNPARSVPWSY